MCLLYEDVTGNTGVNTFEFYLILNSRSPKTKPRLALSLSIFDTVNMPTENCVYPDLVLKFLTRWPTVKSLGFIF